MLCKVPAAIYPKSKTLSDSCKDIITSFSCFVINAQLQTQNILDVDVDVVK